MHAQHRREQARVAEAPGGAQRPAGPPGGGGHSLLGQQVPERDPEGDAGLRQEPHHFQVGVPRCYPGLKAADQRPQLAKPGSDGYRPLRAATATEAP